MEMSLLEKYYKGILLQLQGEVEFINELFLHNGLKGEGNESVIRELIKKFIPKKYSVGTGIVIDRNGKNSKQCDLIIYDSYHYPEILSLSSVHIFPVDFVYAVIEIKTTLDAQSSREAVDNIISSKELDYIKQSFRVNSTEPVFGLGHDTVLFETKSTTQPYGIIFGFRSKVKKFKTFTNWFVPDENEKVDFWPSHIFCLDQGIIIHPTQKDKRFELISPVVVKDNVKVFDENHDTKFEENGRDWIIYNNMKTPLSRTSDATVIIDQTKILLNFITMLDGILKMKLLSPNILFREEYLSKELKYLYNMNNEYKAD